jgi:hypothetical protein
MRPPDKPPDDQDMAAGKKPLNFSLDCQGQAASCAKLAGDGKNGRRECIQWIHSLNLSSRNTS